MLKSKIQKIGLEFDKQFYQRCNKFVSLIQEWGAIHNLTSALHTSQIYDNIIDSIYPLKFLNTFNNFADIGTGSGYPGMLLAIAQPNIKASLIEPKTKK